MKIKSGQQQVFEWLLENEEVLNGVENSALYKKFENSGLSRNRLRSYKSRLKDKINSGAFDPETEKPDFPEESNHLFHFCGKDIKINLILIIKILGFILFNFFIYKLARKIFK